MLRNRRLLTMILVVLFAAALIFSAVFLAAEANHDCHGENCQICQQIVICARILGLFALALIAAKAAAHGRFFAFDDDRDASSAARCCTLISQKIKLSC